MPHRPSKLSIPLACLIGAATSPAISQAATYHVSRAGNDANDCATVQDESDPLRHKASISAGVGCLSAGDTLLIHQGTYVEVVGPASFRASGTSWSAPITIAAYRSCPTCPRDVVTIRAWAGVSWMLSIGPAQRYIILDGLIVDGSVTGGFSHGGISVNSSYVRIQNFEVMNVGGQETDSGMYIAGDHIEILHSRIHDNGWEVMHGHGMYFTANDSLVDGNDIYNNNGDGIQVQNSAPGLGASRNTVRNNRIHHNRSFGGIAAVDGNDNRVYNNLVYNNAETGIAVYPVGQMPPTSDRNLIYNNTLFGNGVCLMDGMPNETANDTRFVNNICFGNAVDDLQIIDANRTVQLTNLFGRDPHFVNPGAGDFRIIPGSGSPALNAGSNLSSESSDFTTDFAGRPRPPTGPWTIGASQAGATQSPAPPQRLSVN